MEKRKLFHDTKFKSYEDLVNFCLCVFGFGCEVDRDNHTISISNVQGEWTLFKTKVNFGGWYLEEIV